jgi:hypothetical protein
VELGEEIRHGAADYAGLVDQATRTSVRARVLHLMDSLELERDEAITTRRVSGDEVRFSRALRGAIVIHLDLVFRSSVSADEVLDTARRGIVRIAEHPRLPEVPVGVVLAAPTRRLAQQRAELFDPDGPALGASDVVMPYALAASPGRLGAGTKLLRAIVADCHALSRAPRVVTLSPLTGMRARVIRMVDDAQVWTRLRADQPDVDCEMLRDQLLDLLGRGLAPEVLGEPSRSWLSSEARSFAEDDTYAVGNFHRGMGASLVGVCDSADARDSDAMWARAYFDYG